MTILKRALVIFAAAFALVKLSGCSNSTCCEPRELLESRCKEFFHAASGLPAISWSLTDSRDASMWYADPATIKREIDGGPYCCHTHFHKNGSNEYCIEAKKLPPSETIRRMFSIQGTIKMVYEK